MCPAGSARRLGPILGWEPLSLILFSAIVTAAYTVASGLSGVAYTDAYQFGIFLIGNIILVPIVLFAAGGMEHVYQTIEATRGAAEAESFFRVLPPVKGLDALTIFAFIVQGLFFAASPTGGEGFTAQRFMAARNEFHAQVGQLFNALLTLIVRVVPFLFLGVIAAALYAPGTVAEPGEIWARMVRTYAPVGLLGLLVAGIFAAYMSTISTLMNWGASYIVNDFYKPFVRTGRKRAPLRLGRTYWLGCDLRAFPFRCLLLCRGIAGLVSLHQLRRLRFHPAAFVAEVLLVAAEYLRRSGGAHYRPAAQLYRLVSARLLK